MIEKIQITKYKCECGKAFIKKSSAIHHETVCKCWKHPILKTCYTCKNTIIYSDSDNYQNWRYRDCLVGVENWTYDYINVNCTKWEAI
jgi:hypothetical protein